MIVLVQSTITIMGDNHRGICILKDEKTMSVYGAVGDRCYYNPCRKDKWNVVCYMTQLPVNLRYG